MDGNIEITKSNTYFYVDSSSNDMILYTGTSNQHILIGTVSNDTSTINISKSNVTFNRMVNFNSNVTIGSNPNSGIENFATLQTANDFAILANDSSWTSNHGGKSLYMRYSTNGTDDAAYIQSIYRDGITSNFLDMNIQASNIYFSTGGINPNTSLAIRTDGKVGIGTSNPREALHVIGNVKTTGSIIMDSNSPILFASNSALGYAARMGMNLFNNSNYLDIVGGAISGDTGRKMCFWINSNQISGIPGKAIFHGGDVEIENGSLLIGTSNHISDGVANIAGKTYIGISNPSNITDAVLHISKSNECPVTLEYVGNQMAQLRLTSNVMKIGIDGTGDISFISGMSMTDGTGGTEIMHMTSSNVFIYSNLTVGGVINASNLQINGAPLSSDNGGGFKSVPTNITYTMCNVGIGLNNPTHALEVIGSVMFSNTLSNLGNVYIASNLFANSLIVNQQITCSNTLSNFGDAYFASNLVVNSNLYVNQQIIASNIVINQKIISSNSLSNLGSVYIGSNLVVNSNLYVVQQVILSNTLSNFGNVYFASNLLINSNLYVNQQIVASNTLSNLGNVYFASNLLINSNLYVKQQVVLSNTLSNLGNASFLSNVVIGSNLYVAQQVVLSNTLSNFNNASFSSNVVIGSNLYTYQIINSNTFSNLGNAYFDTSVTMNSNLYVNTIQVLPKLDTSNSLSSNLSSNLRVNLQTKSITTSRVSTWDIFTQSSAAQQPYWFSNTGINGKSAVSFYTGSNTMMWASNTTFNTSTTGGFTFAMYCKFRSNTFWERVIESLPNSNPTYEQFVVSRSGSACNLHIAFAGYSIDNIPLVTNTYSIVVYRYVSSNNNHKVWQSNVLIYNSNSSITVGSGGWNIGLGANVYGSNNLTTGLSPNQGQFASIDVQGLFMYDRAITDTEVDNLYGYFNSNNSSLLNYFNYTGLYGGNFITNDGYIGIGTSLPTSKLHISDSNSNVSIRLVASNSLISDIGVAANSNEIVIGSKKGDLYIMNTIGSNILFASTSNSNVMTITQSNIGIFNSNPIYTLDVNGSVNITSNVNILGVTTVASNIMPLSNLVYDLGSSNMRFRTLYLASNTIDMQGVQLKVDSATGGLKLTDSNNSNVPLIVNKLIIGSGSNVVHMEMDSNNNVAFKNVTLSNGVEVSSSNTSVGGWSNSSSNIFITGSNVGIGLSNPSKALDVVGDINFTGSLYQNGTPFVSGSGGGGGASSGQLTVDSNNSLIIQTSNTWSVISPILIYGPNNIMTLTGTSNTSIGIVIDSNNSLYSVGTYNSNANLTSVSSNELIVLNLPANGSSSVYLSKRLSTGSMSWIATIDGFGVDDANGISIDTSNNLYIVGSYTLSNPTIYNAYQLSNITVPLLPTPCNNAVFVVKYNNFGIAQWTSTINNATIENKYSICSDTSNNIVVIGKQTNSNSIIYDNSSNFIYSQYSIGRIGFTSTVAGASSTSNGYLDGPSAIALFYNPRGVVSDSNGNIFVADYNNHCIRKITPIGIVSTFVGKGTATYVDGVGTNAGFNLPYGVTIDSSNNLYVADSGNYRIRKITSSGVVTTIAGNATATYTDGIGTNASFVLPTGVAADNGGNLYIADWTGHRIRKIDSNLNVTTVAGSGASTYLDATGTNAGFSGPRLLCIDSFGSNVYVADTGNNRIRKIDLTNSTVTSIIGNGTASYLDGTGTNALVNAPRGVAVDSVGNVYVTDTGNARVRKMTQDGIVTTLAGGTSTYADGLGTNVGFGANMLGICVDFSGNLLITDGTYQNIRKIDLLGTNVTTFVGSGTGTVIDGDRAYASLIGPNNITRDRYGNFYVSESNHTIRKISNTGVVSLLAGSAGISGFANGTGTNALFKNNCGLNVDSSGNVYVVDPGNFIIRKITPIGVVSTFAGNNVGSFQDGIGTTARFYGLIDIVVDSADNLYTLEQTNRRIRKIDKYGLVTTIAGTGIDNMSNAPGTYAAFKAGAWGLGIDSTGSNLYVSESSVNVIRKIVLGTNTKLVAGSGTATFLDNTGSFAGFNIPTGITMDTLSNLYVCDRSNQCIRKITNANVVTTLAGSGTATYVDGTGTNASFNNPWGITIDNSNNVYIVDKNNHMIREINSNTVVTTLAGSGTASFTDDTGTNASFNSPTNVTIDLAGNLFVTDTSNHRIRKVTQSGTVTTFAGTGTATYVDGYGTLAGFNAPKGIVYDPINACFYVNDNSGYIRNTVITGEVSTIAGNFIQTPKTSVGLYASFSNALLGIITDQDNNIFVSESNTHRIYKITQSGGVSVFAGSGTTGSADGLGTNASFNGPFYMTFNSNNDMYVTDYNNHRIRKITSVNYVDTLAGNGTATYIDSNGTNAGFNDPRAIAIDTGMENVFIADTTNYRIRKIRSNGTVSTYLGSGTNSFADGTGTSASIGTCYGMVADMYGNLYATVNNRVRLIQPIGVSSIYTGSGTATFLDALGTNAGFNNPSGIVADSFGNIYVSDSSNHRIRKIATDGTVTTFAGSGTATAVNATGTSAAFHTPNGLAIDNGNNIYVADTNNDRIRKITSAGVVTTIAGQGAAGSGTGYINHATTPTFVKLNKPTGVIANYLGDVFVADSSNHVIRKITSAGSVITVAGSGTASLLDGQYISASFNGPYGLVLDKSNNLFVTDTNNNCIRKITPTAYVTTFAGSGTATYVDGIGTNAGFISPTGISIDLNDNLYVTEGGNRIRKITPTGVVTTLAGSGTATYQEGTGTNASFNAPNGICIYSGLFYVTDKNNNRVRILDTVGRISTFAGSGTATFLDATGTNAGFNSPVAITIDTSNNLYVADNSNYRVRKITSTGVVTTLAGSGTYAYVDATGTNARFTDLWGITISYTNTINGKDYNNRFDYPVLYVTDRATINRVRRITPDGVVTTFAGSGSGTYVDGIGTNAGFISPYGIISDLAGNIYVSDILNQRIRKINRLGVVSTIAGSGVSTYLDGIGTFACFANPDALSIDNYGNIYVAENINNRIRVLKNVGNVTTYAGSGLSSFGDGTSTAAAFKFPRGICWDSYNNAFYVVDTNNYRVRRIGNSLFTTTIAGTGGGNFSDGVGTYARFNNPQAITIDYVGNLYVSDQNNNRIRKLTRGNILNSVTTIAGSGTLTFTPGIGTQSSFNYPDGVAVDSSGNIYIGDAGNNRIRKIDQYGVVTIFAGSGTATVLDGIGTNAGFYSPNDITIDSSGVLYVADFGNRIRKITSDGIVTSIAGSGTATYLDGIGTNAGFNNPDGVVVDTSGNIYVGDKNNHRIRKITQSVVTSVLAGSGTSTYVDDTGTNAGFLSTYGLVVDSSGNVYVADYSGHRIRKITSSGVVTTFAGSGSATFADGIGTNAGFNQPNGLAIDANGNIYVADQSNNRIRKITSSGVVTTLAGGGSTGYVDSIGTNARFYLPRGVAVDSSDNVYVADQSNNRIRKVSQFGVVTTLAGSGTVTFLDGVGTNAGFSNPQNVATDSSGNVYVADIANNRIRKITPSGVVTTFAGRGTATYLDDIGINAGFNTPVAIAIDIQGTLYVSDYNNNIIRKITQSGIVTTLAGSGTGTYYDAIGTNAGFNNPRGIAVDNAGNLYIADSTNLRIRKISTQWSVTTVAGSGTATFLDGIGTNAGFNSPRGVTIDSSGNLYVADFFNNRIRKITSSGVVTTFAGSGTATYLDATGTNAGFYGINGLCIDVNENILVGDFYNNRIRKISQSGIVTTIAGSGTLTYLDGSVTQAGFYYPARTAVDSSGSIYIADHYNHRIRKIYADWITTTIAGSGTATYLDGTGTTAGFNGPRGINIDSTNTNIYVSDTNNHRIRKIELTGTVSSLAGSGTATFADGTGTNASFNNLYGIVYNSINDLFYIADTGNNRIRSINYSGVVNTFVGSGTATLLDSTGTLAGFNGPSCIVSDSLGNLVVADTFNHCIRKISLSGVVTTFAGKGTATFVDGIGTNAGFNSPQSLTIDTNGNIYVADTMNYRIRRITPSGNVTTIVGTGSSGFNNAIGTSAVIHKVYGITVDKNGIIYFCDTDNLRIRKIDTSYNVTTLAGSGTASSNDGTGTNATFHYPRGISLDGQGALYIAEWGGKIRKIIINSSVVTTIAGSGGNTFVDGIGTQAGFWFPSGVTVDKSGDIYVADTNNHRVRKIVQTGVVTTVAGSGTASYLDATGTNATFSSPQGIVRDSSGNLYICDNGNSRIRKITSGNVVTTLAGSGTQTYVDGLGTNASFGNGLYRITIDSSNNLYVTDYGNNRIRKITSGGLVSTYAGSGSTSAVVVDGIGTNAWFNGPYGITIDSVGNLYVAELGSLRIRKIATDLKVTTILGSGTSTFFDSINLTSGLNPLDLAIDSNGNMYTVDSTAHRIRRITIGPNDFVATYAGSGTSTYVEGNGQSAGFIFPYNITCNNLGRAFVTDVNGYRVRSIIAGTVSTYSGTGISFYRDGNNGQFASLNGGISVNSTGVVYVTDSSFVRMISSVDPSIITTIVGVSARTPVDGLGSVANFKNNIIGLCVDANDNLYATDYGSGRIRKITITNYVNRICGTGTSTLIDGNNFNAGIGTENDISINPTNGDIILTDSINHVVRKLVPYATVSTYAGGTATTIDGVAHSASFFNPWGVCSDLNGNIYVSDLNGHCIRKITPDRVVTTIAGSPGISGATNGIGTNALFNSPHGIKIDSNGNLFVADTSNHKIRKITPEGIVSTFVGSGTGTSVNGTGTNASINNPYNIAIDQNNNLYIAEYIGYRLVKVTPSAVATTYVGSGSVVGPSILYNDGTGTNASMYTPTSIAIDSIGNLYVTNYNSHMIKKIDTNLNVTTIAGNGTSTYYDGGSTNAGFNNPIGIAIDSVGENLYVTEFNNHKIRKINLLSGIVTTLCGAAAGYADGTGTVGRFNTPSDICIDKNGVLYVADFINCKIRKIEHNKITTISGSGTATYIEGIGQSSGFNAPRASVVTTQGTIFTTDQNNNRIRTIETDMVSTYAGKLSTATYADGVGTNAGFKNPFGITVDTFGNLYVGDGSNCRIRKIDRNQMVSTIAGNGTATFIDSDGLNSAFKSLTGLCTDPSGNIYVCDRIDKRIRVISPPTIVSTLQSQTLNNPSGIVIDSYNNKYIVNKDAHSIIKVTAQGTSTTFAGKSGTGTFIDGTGTNAGFSNPSKVTLDMYGNLYVTDTNNNRIRKITSSGIVTTIAGSGTATFLDALGTNAGFNSPSGIIIDSNNILYISELNNQRIRKIDANLNVTTVAGSGTGTYFDAVGTNAGFSNPSSIILSTSNSSNILYVSDTGNNTIRKITLDGTVTTVAGSGTATYLDGVGTFAGFNSPSDIAIDINNNIYINDTNNNRIRLLSSGFVSTLAGSGTVTYLDDTGTNAGFNAPTGINVDITGANIYVVGDNKLRKIANTTFTTPVDILVNSSNTLLKNSSNSQSIAVKYDQSGLSQWSLTLNSSGSNTITSVISDSSNNIYVVGTYTSNSQIYRNLDLQTIGLSNYSGSNDVFGLKLSSNGYPQWTVTLNGVGNETVNKCDCDASGNLYFTGSYQTLVNIIDSTNTVTNTLPVQSNISAYLVNFTSNGLLNWRTIVTASNSVTNTQVIGYSITTDSLSNIYLTGTYRGTLSPVITNSSNINSTLTLPVPTGNSGSNSAPFIIKYDSNGTPQKALGFISASNNIVYDIVVTPSGSNIYITGLYSGSNTMYDEQGNPVIISSSNSSIQSSYIVDYNQQSTQFSLRSSLGNSSNGLQKYITNIGNSALTLNITSSNGSSIINSYNMNPTSNLAFNWLAGSWYRFI